MKITLSQLLEQFYINTDLSFLCHGVAQKSVEGTHKEWRGSYVHGNDLFHGLKNLAPEFFIKEFDGESVPYLLDVWLDWEYIYSRPDLNTMVHPWESSDQSGAIMRNRDFRIALLVAIIDAHGDHELTVNVQ
jgi:hypothetical protein